MADTAYFNDDRDRMISAQWETYCAGLAILSHKTWKEAARMVPFNEYRLELIELGKRAADGVN